MLRVEVSSISSMINLQIRYKLNCLHADVAPYRSCRDPTECVSKH